MSNEARKPEAPTESKAPTHSLFHIEERKGKKPFWTEIAVGWENADGSVNVRTKIGAILLPDHDYQLRVRTQRDQAGETAE
ncbi:MAG: hypothetical protein JWR07_98 [Nevskia sp.]|nr:hypothetical protein [Nevskia sp.]